MNYKLKIYNSLTKSKQLFEPLNPPFVGMYVCGPTVYGDPHLGHSRPAITFDIIYRFLKYLGYKVRYVSNITDVGHLENEIEETGEDKIAKKARLEQLEPMEIVQYYTNNYQSAMRQLNVLPPGIEPRASGHIIEQIEMIEDLLSSGYAYEVEGSVYFDVVKYSENHEYGKLSGRVLDDLISGSRKLEGQSEKKNSVDFALWKKAADEHIMKWNSPWGKGFPGWHLECSVMGGKYLGIPFDIHGGGMDLKFPHHECEISQSVAAFKIDPVKYWIHNNLITIDGQKMSKSLGNFITIEDLFTGNHKRLENAYNPMTLRFFLLQTHYRSTLDFSNDALRAAEKGFNRLMQAKTALQKLKYGKKENIDEKEDNEVMEICNKCIEYMCDDFNTAQALASLFDLSTKINSFKNETLTLSSISENTFNKLVETFNTFVEDIFGLSVEEGNKNDLTDGMIELLIEVRKDARANKDFATSDKIRDKLAQLNVQLKDEKDGTISWSFIN